MTISEKTIVNVYVGLVRRIVKMVGRMGRIMKTRRVTSHKYPLKMSLQSGN